MDDVGRNLGQRDEHESAFFNCRVGYVKIGFGDYQRIEKKDVYVDGARTLAHLAFATERCLDELNMRKQFLGLQIGSQFHRAVQKPWLLAQFQWFGLIER